MSNNLLYKFDKSRCSYTNKEIHSSRWAVFIILIFFIILVTSYSLIDNEKQIKELNYAITVCFFLISLMYYLVFHLGYIKYKWKVKTLQSENFLKFTVLFISIIIVMVPASEHSKECEIFIYYPLVFITFMFVYYLYYLLSFGRLRYK